MSGKRRRHDLLLPEEVRIAHQEGQLDLHAEIKMRHVDIDGNVNIIETTCGRVLFNDHVPLKRATSMSS